jgi:hypothetical protein
VGKTSVLESLNILINNPKLAKRKEKGKVHVQRQHNIATDGIELHSISLQEEIGLEESQGGGQGGGQTSLFAGRKKVCC